MKAISAVLILIYGFISIGAQQKELPVLKSNQPRVTIRDGEKLKKDGWRLAPELNPDIYRAELIDGRPHKVIFSSDVDSITFTVEEGKTYDFVIEYEGRRHYTRIIGQRFVPPARFDEEYRRTHRGKTFIEIPEVYELVNIAIALRPAPAGEPSLIADDTDYYRAVDKYFGKHRDHALVRALAEEMEKDRFSYFSLKMDAYAFEFDGEGRIVKSRIYDRITNSSRENSLTPYVRLMQSFADDTDFRRFYRDKREFYQGQIRFFREKLNIDEMLAWLGRQFPEANEYDTYKIVFSPLVRGNQSVNWFESNGFKELQPHVEFPYRSFPGVSAEADLVFRGIILFTEINHGFLNPVTSRYADRITRAVSNRYFWVAKEKGPRYYNGAGNLFDEYMNWALVNLRYIDYVENPEEREKLIEMVDRMMVERRGFPQFADFSRFLNDLYRGRRPGQTVADLYPQIIDWFAERNRRAANLDVLPTRYDDHRFIVEPITAKGEKLRFYTDTGGGLFIFRDRAAGLGLLKPAQTAATTEAPPVELPAFQEDFSIPAPLGTNGKIFVFDRKSDETAHTEYMGGFTGMLGQAWFANRIWTFDYPKQMLIRHKGELEKDAARGSGGRTVPLGFKTGERGQRLLNFPRIQVVVDGEKLDLLFDTGAMTFLTDGALAGIGSGKKPDRAASFITASVFERWRKKHPEWRVIENAERDSGEAMIEVPEVEIAGYRVGPVWFTRRADKNFHEFMTRFMDRRVEGALGGNALRFFRVSVDYPRARAVFEKN